MSKQKRKNVTEVVTTESSKLNTQLPENQHVQPILNSFTTVGIVIFLFTATFLCYAQALNHTFLEWDDQTYVTINDMVLSPSLSNFQKCFTRSVALNYHPITMLSLMLNTLFFGKAAFSFIFTNIVFHSLNVVLVFFTTQKLSKNQIIPSVFVALIFGLHPLRVESVVWISERKDVLYVFFSLLGLFFYLKNLIADSTKNTFLVILFFVMACLSKGQAVVLPILFVLVDFWSDPNFNILQSIKSKIPLFIIALIFGFISLNIQSGSDFFGLIRPNIEGYVAIDIDNFSLFEQIKIGTHGFIFYLQKFFIPTDLSSLYPFIKNPDGNALPVYSYGLVLMPLILGLTFWFKDKAKPLFFGILFYLISTILVLQFLSVGVAVAADRYSYLAHIGISFAFVFGIKQLLEKFKITNLIFYVILVGFLLSNIWLTITYTKYWANTATLFTRRIEIQPNDGRAHEIRGLYYQRNNETEKALEDLQFAMNNGANNPDVFLRLSDIYATKNQKQEQNTVLTKGIGVLPQNAQLYYARATLNYPSQSSIADFEKVMEILPEKTNEIKGLLGVCYANNGNLQKGIATILESIASKEGKNVANYLNLAVCYRQLNDKTLADKAAQQALILDPNNQQAKQMLAE